MMEELQRQKEYINEKTPDISMEKDLEKWMEESLQTEFQNNI